MSSLSWTLILLSLVACVSGENPETTAFPNIPSHLIECYMNDGIYHREFRMPSTFENFLDLLRKVESSPTSRNLNARELSMVLLHYLKLDGIQSFKNHARTSSDILPFAPSGDEYFKHRLTLIGLVPRIDQSYLRAVNETLSTMEMCNLHFMLSYSIDPYKRDNEKCSSILEEERSLLQAEPKSEWNPYQTISRYHPSRSRHVRNVGKGAKRSKRRLKKNLRKREIEELQKLLRKRTLESLKKGSKSMSKKEIKIHEKELRKIEQMLRRRRRSTDTKESVKADVEELPPHIPNIHQTSSSSKKEKFTIGGEELLSNSENKHSKRLQSLIDFHQRYGGRSFNRNGYASDDSVYTGLVPGVPMSDCPVVNGIIKTSFGPLAIGTVVAGIAAGLNPEDIPPVKLSVDPKDMETPSDRIKNVWAVTLAGSVADILSSSALLEIDNFQILKGGWNDTADPKWYLLKNNQFKHLTEVSLRGSLDGLFLGLNAKEFTNKFPSFKLSQMLEIYYDYFWGTVGAKNRVQLRPQYAPDEIFRKQVYLMSLVLKKQKTNVVTVLEYNSIAREAVSRVTSFIQNMDYRSMMTSNEVLTDNVLNVVAVVDSSWGFENLKAIFDLLKGYGVAAVPMQSNLTVLCGSDGKTLFYAENAIDLHVRFTSDTLFLNCSRGLNFPNVMEKLELFYRKLYYDEKVANQVNIDANVAVLFPHESYISDEKDYVENIGREFLQNFPDVRLMVASNGRSDVFNNVVRNPEKDVFVLTPPTIDNSYRTIKDLAYGIKQSYQRISRPSCGSYFDDDSQITDVRFTYDILPGRTAFYRLLPQYFFKASGDVIISIRSRQRLPLIICHSREVDRPENNGMRREAIPVFPNSEYNPNYNPNHDFRPNVDYKIGKQTENNDGPVQCKTIQGEEYKIEMNNPCDSASILADCKPLYISIYSPLTDTVPTPCPNCRLPINTPFEISAVGLLCYNSSSYLSSSPLLIISAILLVLFKVRVL